MINTAICGDQQRIQLSASCQHMERSRSTLLTAQHIGKIVVEMKMSSVEVSDQSEFMLHCSNNPSGFENRDGLRVLKSDRK